MNIFFRTSLLTMLLASFFAYESPADILYSSDFIVTNGTFDGAQYQSGNTLSFNNSVLGWTVAGFHTAHAVQITSDNWALMVFSAGAQANVYTLDTGFAANSLGTTYWVSYEIAPAVYQDAGQETTVYDSLLFSVLSPDDAVVASANVAPGAWAGSETFQQEYFSYVGNGAGDVRLQIASGDPDSGTFAGAIDNIAFWSSVPTPEPSTYALMGLGALGLAWNHRRRVCSR